MTAASGQPVRLGPVQETLSIPLHARAVESRRKRSILKDPMAVQMAEAIDWDFQTVGQRPRVLACALRTDAFDAWAGEFLERYPAGTAADLGAGLNTRFERLDNGRFHWFDLDLPDVVNLRRRLFADTERRTTLAGPLLDPGWIAAVRQCPGPYRFVAETVSTHPEEPHRLKTRPTKNRRGARGIDR